MSEWFQCSPSGSPATRTHIAKRLPAQADDSQWRQFERHAYLALSLSDRDFHLVDWWLIQPAPTLVFTRLRGVRLDEWVNAQAHGADRSMWITSALDLLTALEKLHALGYVHTAVCPEHLWIDHLGRLYLLGLGHCTPVGEPQSAGWTCARFLAPERMSAHAEASSAQDIFASAGIIDWISGGVFGKSPVAKCMQAACPYDRPTAGELVDLFRAYQCELRGPYCHAQADAA